MKNKMKIFKRVISILLSIVIVIFGYFIIMNTIRISKNEIGSFFGYSVAYVPTESMEPNIHSGSTVIFKKSNYDKIQVGDIIVYKNTDENIYVIHRVLEITSDGFIMKGDNNPSIDLYKNGDTYFVTKDLFYGSYVKTINWLSLKSLVQNRTLIFGLCILIFILAFISEGLSIYRSFIHEKKKEEYEKTKEELLEEIKKELLEERKDK